jgi:predicted TIM-barrel fold metal-dependent hydrolase
MKAISIDIQVVFPRPMLETGLHPSPELATELIFAYNRWFCERILQHGPRVRVLIALPFHDPAACMRTVEEFADNPGVIGFLVTSQRHEAIQHRAYMPLYPLLESADYRSAFMLPDFTVSKSVNRFISAHALSFVTSNLVHLTDWVIKGLPERVPRLKVLRIESGPARVPLLIQRLDHEYLMRQSDAPLLKRLPSNYMRGMYYPSQPLEATDMKLLQGIFEAINAQTQLHWASDWPHWDFDPPGRIASLPFMTGLMLRNISGGECQAPVQALMDRCRRHRPSIYARSRCRGGHEIERPAQTPFHEAEGADILTMKPGMPYLDGIALLRERTLLPIAAYHVSGEYALIRFARAASAVEEALVVRESLGASKRTGADPDLFRHGCRTTGIPRTGDTT